MKHLNLPVLVAAAAYRLVSSKHSLVIGAVGSPTEHAWQLLTSLVLVPGVAHFCLTHQRLQL